jgi:16S rRNA (guanine527-N7)-methyltransferase
VVAPGRKADESGSELARAPGGEPAGAAAVFGARLPLARHYARLLVGPGIERGLLGPREAPRIWTRHLLNCAVITDLLPDGARVVDVGSGAGLPGLALAVRRPDLRVDLVESLRRRVDYLESVVTELGLRDSVRVVHGRAEERMVVDLVGGADWATARAVAPLDRLAQWCLPLLRPGGALLALKGESAAAELEEHRARVRRSGGVAARVIQCGGAAGVEPTVVVAVRRGAGAPRGER